MSMVDPTGQGAAKGHPPHISGLVTLAARLLTFHDLRTPLTDMNLTGCPHTLSQVSELPRYFTLDNSDQPFVDPLIDGNHFI